VAPAAIRAADADEAGVVLGLIRELAEYERLADQAVGTAEQLAAHMRGPAPLVEVLLAERDGEPVGFALFYTTFSTFLCRAGIWLEDLYVRPAERGTGTGRALLATVAALAVERDGGRLEWAALDWNEPALGFYRALGARRLGEWITHRLEGEELRRVAGGAGGDR